MTLQLCWLRPAHDISSKNVTVGTNPAYTSYATLVADKATADGAVIDFFAAAVPATSVVSITGELVADGDTFAITITAGSDTETITYTAGGADDAATIAAGLEAAVPTSSAYTLSATGGELTVTRADGVDFAVSAGSASAGTAVSAEVAQTTNGSEAGAGSPIRLLAISARRLVELQTLLDADDNNNGPDTITGFFNAYNGAGGVVNISDLANLHVQMATATVTRDISVSDASPQTVVLSHQELRDLGEGSVTITATQTDAVGNLPEGRQRQ